MTLYTTGCPRCTILKTRLDRANIPYTVCDDLQIMEGLGFREAPMLEIDGQYMNFVDAIAWLRKTEGDS